MLQKKLGETEGDTGTLYRPEIKIQYQVQDTTYRPVTYDIHLASSPTAKGRWPATATPAIGRGYPRAVERFTEGQKYPCWYDPANPGVAVLVRGYQWWIWLVFLVPGSFIGIVRGGRFTRSSAGKIGRAPRRDRATGAADRIVRPRSHRRAEASQRPGPERHHQQSGHQARLSPAVERFARLDAAGTGGGVRAVERHRLVLRRGGGRRLSWRDGPTGS